MPGDKDQHFTENKKKYIRSVYENRQRIQPKRYHL